MLVLSRKVGQEIRLVEAGVTIRVTDSRPNKVQLSIDAPRELTVLRGELDENRQHDAEARSAQAALDRLAHWAESVDPANLGAGIAVVDDLIERLVALRLAARDSQALESTEEKSFPETVARGSAQGALSVHQPKEAYRVDSESKSTKSPPSLRFYTGGSCAGSIASGCELV